MLDNRIYLGELTFRDITTTDCHEPIIDPAAWEQAHAILDARGESHAHRAASGSDYLLTGRLRCPKCGKAMIGTRATGRNRTYRYYTCWNLARYDATVCNAKRLDADTVDTAVLDSLASFYRRHHALIAEAVHEARARHRAAHADRQAELATIDAEITESRAASTATSPPSNAAPWTANLSPASSNCAPPSSSYAWRDKLAASSTRPVPPNPPRCRRSPTTSAESSPPAPTTCAKH